MGGWAVEADRDRCMGTGACAFAVPEVFAVDELGRVQIVGTVIPGDERVRVAVEECPMGALRLLEEEEA